VKKMVEKSNSSKKATTGSGAQFVYKADVGKTVGQLIGGIALRFLLSAAQACGLNLEKAPPGQHVRLGRNEQHRL
jgi:hypothetical protein